MSGYNTFGTNSNNNNNGIPNELHRRVRSVSNTSSLDQSDETHPPAPHLYSTPYVSRALVSAFGLPTLVEYEAPSVTTPSAAAATTTTVEPTPSLRDSSNFEPVKRSHIRSHSLPASAAPPATRITGSYQSQQKRGFSRSTITRTGSHEEGNTNQFYTYRVRTYDKENEHHILMCQNPDGTYSHANADGEPLAASTYGDLDGTGEGLMLHDLKGSVSLDTIAHLDETLTHMDESHVHPEMPVEMLDPQFTHTAPPLKLWPLAVLVFYNVSGGPFGIEPSIRAGGNFYAILGFLLFPLVWSVPEAMITAELGAAFQDPSAGVAWVEEAFGETWGAVCGYLNWVSGATDNAIYPTLFMEYVTSVAGWNVSGAERFGYVAAITIGLAMVNYTGLEIVGHASLVVCIIAMSPFVLLTIIGAPKVVPSRWFQLPEDSSEGAEAMFDDDFQTSPGPLPLLSVAGIMWRPFLNNMFWNLNSFDAAASFAGETSCVRTTYPRGIYVGLVMCVLLYILPLLVAVGATDYKQSEWVDGHLGAVAVDIGGNWLGAWTIFAAGISNLALFEAEMSADAFRLMGMAERGYLPKIFQKRSKNGAPTTGIIVGTVVILMFGCADFGTLLELLNANYALALLMEYAAFVKLRLYHKDLPRPYRIPVPDWMAVFIAIPPTLGIIAIFATSNWFVYFFCSGAIFIGFALFKLGEVSKRRGWFTYETKDRFNQYAMSPVQDDGTEPTEGSTIATGEKEDSPVNPPGSGADETGEWDYKNEELEVIQEENKLV